MSSKSLQVGRGDRRRDHSTSQSEASIREIPPHLEPPRLREKSRRFHCREQSAGDSPSPGTEKDAQENLFSSDLRLDRTSKIQDAPEKWHQALGRLIQTSGPILRDLPVTVSPPSTYAEATNIALQHPQLAPYVLSLPLASKEQSTLDDLAPRDFSSGIGRNITGVAHSPHLMISPDWATVPDDQATFLSLGQSDDIRAMSTATFGKVPTRHLHKGKRKKKKDVTFNGSTTAAAVITRNESPTHVNPPMLSQAPSRFFSSSRLAACNNSDYPITLSQAMSGLDVSSLPGNPETICTPSSASFFPRVPSATPVVTHANPRSMSQAPYVPALRRVHSSLISAAGIHSLSESSHA